MFWSRPKIEFSAAPKDFVTAQKLNLPNANHLLVWHKKFGTVTIALALAKKFGPAQNILRSVEGQGIRITAMISSQCIVAKVVESYSLT